MALHTAVPTAGRADRLSVRSFLVAFAIAEGFLTVFEFFGNDSPGLGFAILFFGCPLAIVLLGVFVGMCVSALVHRRRWLAASRLIGPLAAVSLCAFLLRSGLPPWRFVFEALRPYYLVKVWSAATDAQGHKTLEFTLIDKELWNGHERLTIFYSDAGVEPGASAAKSIDSYTCERTEHTHLGSGFSAQHIFCGG